MRATIVYGSIIARVAAEVDVIQETMWALPNKNATLTFLQTERLFASALYFSEIMTNTATTFPHTQESLAEKVFCVIAHFN